MIKSKDFVTNSHRTKSGWNSNHLPNAGFDEKKKEALRSTHLSDPSGNNLDVGEEAEFTISVPAYRPVFGRDSRPLRRISWVVLSLIFFAVAVIQVENRISYYLSTPLETVLEVINNDTLIFPRVTICNRNIVNSSFITPELKSKAAKALGVNESDITQPGDMLSVMNVSTLWTIMANNLTTQSEQGCWFGLNTRCNETGHWSVIHTARGPCYSFELNAPVSESGYLNGLYMQIEGNIAQDNPSDEVFEYDQPSSTLLDWSGNARDSWVVLTHNTKVNPALVFMDKNNFMSPGMSVDTQIRIYQYDYLNVWHSPCTDDPSYSLELCKLQCFTEMYVEKFTCLLPFMQLSADSPLNNIYGMCNTSESYNKAILELTVLFRSGFWNPNVCAQCSYPCYYTIYAYNFEKVLEDSNPNQLQLRIFYMDKLWEKGHQNLMYDLISLFCDIGNSIGLLLGASVLTLVEALEWGLISAIRCIMSCTGQVQRSRAIPFDSGQNKNSKAK